ERMAGVAAASGPGSGIGAALAATPAAGPAADSLAPAPEPCDLAGATWRASSSAPCPARLQSRDLIVSARWRVGERPPDDELAFFAQILDDRGRRLAGRDRAGVEPGRLEPGDEVITWGRMAAPAGLAPGRYWLALGAYRARDTRRLAAL